MMDKPDYYLCVYCGHERVLYKDKEKHEQTQDHQDFSVLNWYHRQLRLRGWTIEKLKEVQDRLTTKKSVREEICKEKNK